MNNELFKLITRRYLAWAVAGVAVGTLAFAGIWSVINGVMALATLTLGMLGTTIASIVGFYFAKKLAEE